MRTNKYLDKIANILANESVSIDFHTAVGDSKSTAASISNTDMDNEVGRVPATVTFNNNTLLFSSQINGFDFSGETVREVGVFDDDTNGNLIERATVFTPFTLEGDHLYFVKDFSDIDQSNNTALTKVTDKAIENIYGNMDGTTTDYPTHMAFSTHLIFDTFNATTGWTPTGGTVATSTNRQEGTNSVALTKTTTGASVVSMTKSLGSAVDASDVETLRMWLRIDTLDTLNKLTETSCVEIRFGSDSSNYKSIEVDRDALTTIWTLLELDVDDFSDTGTPDLANMDYLYIAFNTNNNSDTWSGEELLIDFMGGVWPLAKSDNTLHEEIVRKAISTVELNSRNVRYSGALGTSEGNTYNYYYIGLFDDASSGDMFAVSQLYLTEKNDGKQINFFAEVGVRFV